MSEERKTKTKTFAPNRDFVEMKRAGLLDPQPAPSLPQVREKREAAFALRGGFTPTGLDAHCTSRGFYNVPVGDTSAEVKNIGEGESFVMAPDAILQCILVPRRAGETLQARISLGLTERVFGPSISQLIVQVLPAEPDRKDGDVDLSVKASQAFLNIHLSSAKLSDLIAVLTRDVCPTLALSCDFGISGADLARAGGRMEGGRLELPEGGSVKGRIGGMTTACPRLIRSRLNLIQKAGGL